MTTLRRKSRFRKVKWRIVLGKKIRFVISTFYLRRSGIWIYIRAVIRNNFPFELLENSCGFAKFLYRTWNCKYSVCDMTYLIESVPLFTDTFATQMQMVQRCTCYFSFCFATLMESVINPSQIDAYDLTV